MPLDRLGGHFVEMSLKKGLETTLEGGPKGDLKEKPPKNMENMSSIHCLVYFSHVERYKKKAV